MFNKRTRLHTQFEIKNLFQILRSSLKKEQDFLNELKIFLNVENLYLTSQGRVSLYDIIKLIIEKTIIDTIKFFKIETFADKKNIGIWYDDNNEIKKVAAIGVRVSKWIAYHGFSININNELDKYKAIIPCGISDRGVTNLKTIVDQNYDELENKLVENFLANLKI